MSDFLKADSFAQPPGTPPLAHHSRKDLQHLYSLLVSASAEHIRYRQWLHLVCGAEVAISQGERDFTKAKPVRQPP